MVSSSLFYAMKNPILVQDKILNIESIATDKSLPTNKNKSKVTPQSTESKTKALGYTFKPLTSFDPDYKEKELNPKTDMVLKVNELPYASIRKESQTKLILTRELANVRERFNQQKQKKASKTNVQKLKRISKKELKKKREKIISSLDKYVNSEKVQIRQSLSISKDEVYTSSSSIETNSLNEVNQEPFAFTKLSEWLIWHNSFPELSHVREAYDLDEVPEDSEVEIFWVNILDEPSFFNPNWKIAGTRVYDKNSFRSQNYSPNEPEWSILSSLTDGFSLFFEDVWKIIAISPDGIQNYRYPILQLALKGLISLDLIEYRKGNWFTKGSLSELRVRVKELDIFIASQESPTEFEKNVKQVIKTDLKWNFGIIAFDLFITNSTFIKAFKTRQDLSEVEKVETINRYGISNEIVKSLNNLEKLDSRRVRQLEGILLR